MAQDLIRYDLLAQDALRGVVRTVLTDAAKSGLPGDHHFFIAFETTAPGVRVSNRLREQYPEEMTVVLQHQFWDLEVTETGFTVSLSFNGVPEKLVVPFSAIKGFFDPSVQFGLQFEPVLAEEDAAEAQAEGEESAEPRPAASVTGFEAPLDSEAAEAGESSLADEADDADRSAEVVSLDAFRKKS